LHQTQSMRVNLFLFLGIGDGFISSRGTTLNGPSITDDARREQIAIDGGAEITLKALCPFAN
jgi:hypothetical protein